MEIFIFIIFLLSAVVIRDILCSTCLDSKAMKYCSTLYTGQKVTDLSLSALANTCARYGKLTPIFYERGGGGLIFVANVAFRSLTIWL
jgi:hypothetical protein